MLHCRSINHATAPLELREPLSFSPAQQADWLRGLSSPAVLLSTCNRLELYTFAESSAGVEALWGDLLAQKGFSADDLAPYTLHLTEQDAARHLFQVAGSLRSMVLGEAQILGQVSDAFAQAQTCGTGDGQISLLFRAAIHAAKRIQAETAINLGNVSVSSAGIRQVEQKRGSLADCSILIVGAGEMGGAVIKGLKGRGLKNIRLLSRTLSTAERVAARWEIEAEPLSALKDLLLSADVLFMTSSAPAPILNAADLRPLMAARQNRPLSIVDIALPRDVARDVRELEGVQLLDLDDLQQVVEVNHQERQQAIPQAERIIEAELAHYARALGARSASPTIQQLREQADQLRQQELQRIQQKLAGGGGHDLSELLEEFSHRLINKMLHQPIHSLRSKAEQGNGAYLDSAARDLFGLSK